MQFLSCKLTIYGKEFTLAKQRLAAHIAQGKTKGSCKMGDAILFCITMLANCVASFVARLGVGSQKRLRQVEACTALLSLEHVMSAAASSLLLFKPE